MNNTKRFCLVLCALLGVNGNNPTENNHRYHDVGDKRIVGGDLALIQDYPYTVAVGIRDPSYNFSFYWSFICGGSIISNQHILTAGHCFTEGYELRVKLGTSSINSTDGTEINVTAIYRHPDFVTVRAINYNDIAVLKLSKPITFDKYANKISLPAPNSEPTNSTGVITGWGLTSSNATIPSVWLMKADIPVLTAEECIKKANTVNETTIRDTNICTLNAGRRKGSCGGDSGGPLVQDGKLIGVLSFGPLVCEKRGSPSVYTKVSKFVNWINEQLKK